MFETTFTNTEALNYFLSLDTDETMYNTQIIENEDGTVTLIWDEDEED